MNPCPCASGRDFANCCEPVIQDQSAPTALALMRSRYTAYTTAKAEYIRNTTHPNTRQDHKLQDIEEWARENVWNKLEIISAEHGNKRDSRGIVEFKAYYTDNKGKQQIHHERSTFLKEEEQWFYLDGKFDPQPADLSKKVSRNDPCPCGSGKKHKKCCG